MYFSFIWCCFLPHHRKFHPAFYRIVQSRQSLFTGRFESEVVRIRALQRLAEYPLSGSCGMGFPGIRSLLIFVIMSFAPDCGVVDCSVSAGLDGSGCAGL